MSRVPRLHEFVTANRDEIVRRCLAFSRWGIETNSGRVDARNIPGTGCIFTIDLSRLHAMAVAAG